MKFVNGKFYMMNGCKFVMHLTLFALLSILLCKKTHGQLSSISYEHKYLDLNGKRHRINTILPSASFSWVITNNGIFKFNGEGFLQIYFNEKFDSYPSRFLLDKNDNLWKINPSNQSYISVEIFLSSENRFIPIHEYVDTSMISFEKEKIHKYFQDDYNNIWFIYTDGKVLRFNKKLESFGEVDLLNFTYIEQVYDEIAILNYGSIQIKDSLCKLKKILYNPYRNLSIKESKRHQYTLYSTINSIEPNTEISFWENDTKIDSTRRTLVPTKFKQSEILYHDESNCFINFADDIIEIEDRQSGIKKIFEGVKFNYYYVKKPKLKGNIFFPTKEGIGLIKYSDFDFHKLSFPQRLSARDLSFFNDSTIYISSYSGQMLYNLKQNTFKNINPKLNGYGIEKIGDNLWLQPSHSGRLFLSDHSEAIPQYSEIKFDNYKNSTGVLKLPVFHKQSNTLFFATKYHLIRVNKFFPLRSTYKLQYLPLDDIANINDAISINDNIYFSTDLKICTVDENGNILKVPIDYEKQGFTCLKYHNNNFYVGTKTGSILILDKTFNIIDNINYNNGLRSSTIYTIEIDDKNNLWCGTEQGLIYIENQSHRVIQFTKAESIPSNDFNYKSSAFHNGKMYFGTNDGIFYFDPNTIITSLYKNDITLIHVDKSNLSNPQQFSLIKNDDHDFDANTSTLRFMFGSKHRGLISQNMLDYKFAELDNSWTRSRDGLIEIKGLPYGKHHLNLRNNFSLNETAIYPFDSIRPYYQKWWWFSILALCILALIILIITYYARLFKTKSEVLQLEVQKRTSEINNKKEKLLQSNNAKDKIFSVLAHDLKTPINNLSSLSETIEFLLKENRLDELRAVSSDIKNKTNEVKNLVDNLLHWSLQEQDKIFISNNNFKIIGPIDNILNQFKNQIKDKDLQVSVKIDDEHKLNSDYSGFEAVVRNVISNAIKFSYKKGKLEISSNETEDQLEIKVIDNGTGIESTQIENIHKQAYMSTRGPYNEKGIGIGLMLSFYFMNKMNGEIQFEKHQKQGTIAKIIFRKTEKNAFKS